MPHIQAQKSEKSSIQPSRVVPHRSTAWTRPSLTSLFRWEAVSLDDVAALEMHRVSGYKKKPPAMPMRCAVKVAGGASLSARTVEHVAFA